MREIDDFTNYFFKQLLLIDRVQDKSAVVENKVIKKVLLVSLIDSLGYVYKNCNSTIHNDFGNAKTFMKILEDFPIYTFWETISLPMLRKKLTYILNVKNKGVQRKDFELIIKQIDNALGEINMQYGHINIDQVDSKITEEKLISKNKKINDIINDCKHKQLFYRYRNALVHEFREPGVGFDSMADGLPCYQLIDPNNELELAYPTTFFRNLAEEILKEIKSFLENNNINPYEKIPTSFYWNKQDHLTIKEKRNLIF